MNRALTCSREIARNHIHELAAELIRLGILTDAEQQGPGKWTGKVDLTRIYTTRLLSLLILEMMGRQTG